MVFELKTDRHTLMIYCLWHFLCKGFRSLDHQCRRPNGLSLGFRWLIPLMTLYRLIEAHQVIPEVVWPVSIPMGWMTRNQRVQAVIPL